MMHFFLFISKALVKFLGNVVLCQETFTNNSIKYNICNYFVSVEIKFHLQLHILKNEQTSFLKVLFRDKSVKVNT